MLRVERFDICFQKKKKRFPLEVGFPADGRAESAFLGVYEGVKLGFNTSLSGPENSERGEKPGDCGQ